MEGSIIIMADLFCSNMDTMPIISKRVFKDHTLWYDGLIETVTHNKDIPYSSIPIQMHDNSRQPLHWFLNASCLVYPSTNKSS